MDFKLDAFPADEKKNGVRSRDKIKILICYVFKSVNQPLAKDTILSTLYDNSIANYFEISQALYELENNGALSFDDDLGKYVMTQKGYKIADELSQELSVYIKHKAAQAAMKTLLYEKRLRETRVNINRTEDGKYRVDIKVLSMLPGEGEEDSLLDLSMYVPDMTQAEVVKRSFLNNPSHLYQNVVDALTEETEFVD